MQRLRRRISSIFRRRTRSLEKPQSWSQDNAMYKSIRGNVTHVYTDYGWINENIFFTSGVVCGNIPLNVGMNVIALVEDEDVTRTLKAIKVKAMTDPVESMEPSKVDRRLCIRCVTSVTHDSIYISKDTSFPKHLFNGEFVPFKGDLLLMEYAMDPGSSKMTIHSASPLHIQNIDDVCVTSIEGKIGIMESNIFFSLESLTTPPDYTPEAFDIVNVVVVETLQPHCTWRAVSMTPAQICVSQAF